jgi:GNAT superfamily N-acetyltransferase
MIKEINFDTIKQIWEQSLWPGRTNITPLSNLRYKDIPNVSISHHYTATFFAYHINNKIVGVNSGHSSSRIHYRSRGLWVDPNYRQQGIGSKLLIHTIEQAKKENKFFCWSLPRKNSLSAYINAGFEQTSDFFETETSEFNCYVIKKL